MKIQHEQLIDQILININLVIITTNHIYIGAVDITSGLIRGLIRFGLSIILPFVVLKLFQ